MSFNTAITGLKAASTSLDVAGNNIANASTVGFKGSRTEFSDVYTKAVGVTTANIPGSGVQVSDIAQDFSAGTLEYTNNQLDLAINGAGFFILDDGLGGTTYTRAGAFELDREGFIVSKNGKNLRGYGLDELGNQLPITNLQVTEKEDEPKATEIMDLSFNIDARLDPLNQTRNFDKLEPSSYSYSVTVGTYDSLGAEQSIRYYMVEQAPFREQYQFSSVDPAGPTPAVTGGAGVVNYDPTVDFRISGLPVDGSGAPGTLSFDAATATAAGAFLDVASQAELFNADPRIDPQSVFYNFATDRVEFEFFAEYTQYGDPIVTVQGVEQANLQLSNDFERTANEIQAFELDETLFTSGATLNQLGADTIIEIAGTQIEIPAVSTVVDAGDLIQANEARIINNNPEIQSIRFEPVGTTYQLVVTYEADEGDVLGNIPVSVVAGNPMFLDADLDGAPDVTQVQKGDNSFLGSYRMYAYLNDEDALDLGKVQDPGTVGAGVTETGPIMINFDNITGNLSRVNGTAVLPDGTAPRITVLGSDRQNPTDIILDSDVDALPGIQLDLTGSSQYASESIVKALDSDGHTKGDLLGVSFTEDGIMVASYSNGQDKQLGIVALATFENTAGLQPSGGTEWVATIEAGFAVVNPPQAGLNGAITGAALEESNVDLSTELVKLIEGQRDYQANSKTLETMNTVTQTLLNI